MILLLLGENNMLPLTILKKLRVSYRTMKTKDLQNLLDDQKRRLQLIGISKNCNISDPIVQKIQMIEEELKNREQSCDCQL